MHRTSIGLVLALPLVLAALMWTYYAHTRQLIERRLDASGFPQRHFSDLFPRWLGTRELLLYDRDPYSMEITSEIQRGYYGRPIDSTRPSDPIDEQRFAYPLFVVFLLAPTITLPFAVVKMLFTVILFAAVVATVLLWVQYTGVEVHWDRIWACVLFTVASIPYVEGIQLQQLGLLVAFLLAAAVHALAKEKFVIAGVLLAAATIKPQLCIWVIGFVLLWCMSSWKRRKWVVISFSVALIALLLSSEALLSGWLFEFLAGIPPYLRYTQAVTGIHELFGSVGGTVILFLLGGAIATAAWRAKSEPADSDDFRLALSLVLAFTCIGIPSLAPHNQVLLVPACLLLVKERNRVWASGRLSRALWTAAWLAIAWPWATGTALAITLLFHHQSSRFWDLPFATNPLIPIAVLAALMPLLIRGTSTDRFIPINQTSA